MAYDKDGWLQLPYAARHKLPRWMACRWMQLTLAIDFMDFEVIGIAPDGQPVLNTEREGVMTARCAFGDRDNSGRFPLKLLRDCAMVDRGQSQILDQDWYNEALASYFEQCSNWCQRQGHRALRIIEQQTMLRLVERWDDEYEGMHYSWDELDGEWPETA